MEYSYDYIDEVLDPEGTVVPLPWSTPECSDRPSENTAYCRLARAMDLARTVPAFVCKYCGKVLPGVTLTGTIRRACDRPKCYGRYWHDASQKHEVLLKQQLDGDESAKFGELTPNQVRNIRSLRAKGMSYTDIQRATKIKSRSVIAGVSRGERYAWVTDETVRFSCNELFDTDPGFNEGDGL
jgi:hypothetical protein